MKKWTDERELYLEISRHAGDSADAVYDMIQKWRSSLPALTDTRAAPDIINQATMSVPVKHGRKSWMAAAGVAAVILAGLLMFDRVGFKEVHSPAVCKAIVGEVVIVRDGRRINLANGMEVLQSDTVISGKNSMAVIEVGSAIVRVEQNSELAFDTVINAEELSLELTLQRGLIYSTVEKLQKYTLSVATRTAVASVRGTTFMIRSDDTQTKLIVIEGRVMMAPRLPPGEAMSTAGVAVEQGMMSVIDEADIRSITKAHSKKIQTLDDIIKQTVTVRKVDEKTLNSLRLIADDIDRDGMVDAERRVLIKDITGIQSATPYNNNLIIATNSAVYFGVKNMIEWVVEGPYPSKPYIWDNRIIVGYRDSIISIDKKGRIEWRTKIKGNVLEDGILSLKNTIAVPTDGGILYFIDKNGNITRTVDCGAPFASKPVYFNQLLCIATADGYLYAIDIILGVSIYRKHIGAVVGNGIFARYPELYVVTPSQIQKIHLFKDEVVWTIADSGIVSAVQCEEGVIYATGDGWVSRISGTGIMEWRKKPGFRIQSLKTVPKGVTVIADNIFHYLSAHGETLWSYTLPAKNAGIFDATSAAVYINIDGRVLPLRL